MWTCATRQTLIGGVTMRTMRATERDDGFWYIEIYDHGTVQKIYKARIDIDAFVFDDTLYTFEVPDKTQLCRDNALCCDDNCTRCANLVYQGYLSLKKQLENKL